MVINIKFQLEAFESKLLLNKVHLFVQIQEIGEKKSFLNNLRLIAWKYDNFTHENTDTLFNCAFPLKQSVTSLARHMWCLKACQYNLPKRVAHPKAYSSVLKTKYMHDIKISELPHIMDIINILICANIHMMDIWNWIVFICCAINMFRW